MRPGEAKPAQLFATGNIGKFPTQNRIPCAIDLIQNSGKYRA